MQLLNPISQALVHSFGVAVFEHALVQASLLILHALLHNSLSSSACEYLGAYNMLQELNVSSKERSIKLFIL